MSNAAEDFKLAQALRAKLREVENRLAQTQNKSVPTRADEQEMTAMQARADEVYVKAGRKAPPPLHLELPPVYRRRLAQGLQEYSPKLQGVDLTAIGDDALRPVEAQVYADAAVYGPTAGLRAGEMRPVEKISEGGHRLIEYAGGARAHFSQAFRPPVRFARLRSRGEYEQMARDAAMRQVTEIARHPPLSAPRATF